MEFSIHDYCCWISKPIDTKYTLKIIHTHTQSIIYMLLQLTSLQFIYYSVKVYIYMSCLYMYILTRSQVNNQRCQILIVLYSFESIQKTYSIKYLIFNKMFRYIWIKRVLIKIVLDGKKNNIMLEYSVISNGNNNEINLIGEI